MFNAVLILPKSHLIYTFNLITSTTIQKPVQSLYYFENKES